MGGGQIKPHSAMGRRLTELAQDVRFVAYVEIGTWDGEGSTLCLMRGIRQREGVSLLSLEADPDRFRQALQRWEGVPGIRLLHGRIVEVAELLPLEAASGFPMFDRHGLWRASDIERLGTCQSVWEEVPAQIDVVLVLDGGQFSTYPEWQKLKSRTTCVVLDDTTTLKTARIRKELLADDAWTILDDHCSDRNGWLVAERGKHEPI